MGFHPEKLGAEREEQKKQMKAKYSQPAPTQDFWAKPKPVPEPEA